MKTNAVTMARFHVGLARATAARYAGIGQQSLANLERAPGANRPDKPENCKLGTILRICELYWPVLNLEDLVPDSPFKLVPRDPAIARALRRNVGKPLG